MTQTDLSGRLREAYNYEDSRWNGLSYALTSDYLCCIDLEDSNSDSSDVEQDERVKNLVERESPLDGAIMKWLSLLRDCRVCKGFDANMQPIKKYIYDSQG
ncbi:hypothetical protein TNCV_539451 [Trichonephila clavipes]|nr:hypothetical protein TNCV_539451 [Trichonephila clavipes]